jgi:monoamine oxidase
MLKEYVKAPHTLEIFEASPRLGGKIVTRSFPSGAKYEAGAAEFYNYSTIGADPLRELIAEFGLPTVDMSSSCVVLGDTIVPDAKDIAGIFGAQSAAAVEHFFERCAALMSPDAFYGDEPDLDNAHPLTQETMRQFLDHITDATARHYVESAIHSDLATEPHDTTALYGIKNVLLDDPRYASYYCIVGGNERLIASLVKEISAQTHVSSRVCAAEFIENKDWRLTVEHAGVKSVRDFDIVIFALPNYWLGGIEWRGDQLRNTMKRYEAHYDRPGHYLRVTAHFRRPFWRDHMRGSWFMHDAFGGCCVYDESSRHPTSDGTAVLSWLIAGTDALALSSLDDTALVDRVVGSLPKPMAHGHETLIDAHVMRWTGTVSALPGGASALHLDKRHMPDADALPNLYVAGDYQYDTTINGALDAADFVAEHISLSIADADDIGAENGQTGKGATLR